MMKLIKDLGDGCQIVQYGEWKHWDEDGNLIEGPDSRLMQAIKETMRDLGINSGVSTDE